MATKSLQELTEKRVKTAIKVLSTQKIMVDESPDSVKLLVSDLGIVAFGRNKEEAFSNLIKEFLELL